MDKPLGAKRGARLLKVLAAVATFAFPAYVLNSWNPRLALSDGPYKGTKTSPRLSGTPDSSIQVGDHLTLEAYDATTSSTSALVQMRHDSKGVLWAIHADARRPGDTRSLRFKAVEKRWRGYEVTGRTKGSLGNEATWWQVNGGGDLQKFYNSW